MLTFIVLLVAISIIVYIKWSEKKRILRALDDVLDCLDKGENCSKFIPKLVRKKYKELNLKIEKQKNELDNSISGLKEYREELEATYDSLIKKSDMLKYANQALEKKVANLSNLNALSRTVLSVIELEKIVGIILDAYFVLTGVKRISLYLWEGGELKLKKTKGNIKFKGGLFFEKFELESFTSEDYMAIYQELSRQFRVETTERVIVSPLVVKDKQLGVIFVIEDKEKAIDADDELISSLVIQISIAINNAQIYSELLIKERISKELEVAARMQKKVIPQDIKNVLGLDVANYFAPAKEIGGDFYDYYIHGENLFSITMADVSGKGVPAAFLMALARSIMRTLATKGVAPREDLEGLNQIIYQDITEDMFITVMHCKYDYNTKRLYYSNAGHNPILIYHAKEKIIRKHTVKGIAIGFLENCSYGEDSVVLEKDDIVILYTDGIVECQNEENEFFGFEKLEEIIYENREREVEDIKNRLLQEIENFRGNAEQGDDITFVILKNVEE